MNCNAAALADSKRFGAISVEHMLRDTSNARIIVALLDGSVTVEVGRANAIIKLDIANKNNTNGKCRFHCDCLGRAERIKDRLEKRTLYGFRRRKTKI